MWESLDVMSPWIKLHGDIKDVILHVNLVFSLFFENNQCNAKGRRQTLHLGSQGQGGGRVSRDKASLGGNGDSAANQHPATKSLDVGLRPEPKTHHRSLCRATSAVSRFAGPATSMSGEKGRNIAHSARLATTGSEVRQFTWFWGWFEIFSVGIVRCRSNHLLLIWKLKCFRLKFEGPRLLSSRRKWNQPLHSCSVSM